MEYHDVEHERSEPNGHTARGFLAGMLIGGLAGAGAMLLLAPQSGKQTRAQIQKRGAKLRDQAVETVDDAVAQTRAKAGQFAAGVREMAGELQQRGQDVLAEQKERVATMVGAGKKAAARTGG